jgi:sporadic carbohydrate cluster 2OG-Fe(II) oxygenase
MRVVTAARRQDDETAFVLPEEASLATRFLEQGHVIVPVEDRPGLDRIREQIATFVARHLDLAIPHDPGAFLDGIHNRVTGEALNALRLAVIEGLNATPWARPTYFRLARRALDIIVGNELAMQRRLNLSVQMPEDTSSLLPVHSDVWDGDSPFEIVVWLPLVDVFRTKSMFLLPPAANARTEAGWTRFAGKSAEDLFKVIEPDLTWLDIPYGHILLFQQNLMHGNTVNRESTTRWSMNCRFKSVMSPYAEKRLGDFFEPITLKAATRLGMSYKLPEGHPE